MGTLFAYLAAAIAVLGFMGTPTHLASYRDSGVLRPFRAAGVPSRSLVVPQVVVMAALAMVGCRTPSTRSPGTRRPGCSWRAFAHPGSAMATT